MSSKLKKYISGGTKRCVQASYRMVVHALTGDDPGEDAADIQTGYVEGRGTWQFRMLLALADYSLKVVDHELIDTQLFLMDPAEAIRAQAGNELVAQQIIDETDIEAEKNAVRKCLENPLITFEESVPSIEQMEEELRVGNLLLVNVNSRVLRGQKGRQGHILIIENIDDDMVTYHDPGIDGGLNKQIEKNEFVKAWHSPSVEMANYIAVSG